jgi:hypothetical protein
MDLRARTSSRLGREKRWCGLLVLPGVCVYSCGASTGAVSLFACQTCTTPRHPACIIPWHASTRVFVWSTTLPSPVRPLPFGCLLPLDCIRLQLALQSPSSSTLVHDHADEQVVAVCGLSWRHVSLFSYSPPGVMRELGTSHNPKAIVCARCSWARRVYSSAYGARASSRVCPHR